MHAHREGKVSIALISTMHGHITIYFMKRIIIKKIINTECASKPTYFAPNSSSFVSVNNTPNLQLSECIVWDMWNVLFCFALLMRETILLHPCDIFSNMIHYFFTGVIQNTSGVILLDMG